MEETDVAVTQPAIVVLALSRGRGVPADTRRALTAIEELANVARDNGTVISVTREVFGLEGETRLCIVFRDESALAEAREDIQELSTGVDLLTVTKESCSAKRSSHGQ